MEYIGLAQWLGYSSLTHPKHSGENFSKFKFMLQIISSSTFFSHI